MLKIRVPATTANLGPGFDCLGMALSIYNQISIAHDPGGDLEILVSGPAATSDIPVDDTNLVHRAAARVFAVAGRDPSGLKLNLHLDSPLARGMGSSASAIVGGMVAANELLGQPLSINELALEATRMEGHPDNVVPCLVGGLTVSLELEDRVIFDKTLPAPNVTCVLFVPDYELETSKARAVMPAQVSIKDAVFNASRIPFVLSKLQHGDLEDLDGVVNDRLHQPYRIPLIKGYNEVREAALKAGAAAVCISGAGPTILAICPEETARQVAAAGVSVLQQVGVSPDCRVVKPDVDGCVVETQ